MSDGGWELVSAGALATAIGENPLTVDYWCQNKRITAVPMYGQWYLPKAEYDRIVEFNQSSNPTP